MCYSSSSLASRQGVTRVITECRLQSGTGGIRDWHFQNATSEWIYLYEAKIKNLLQWPVFYEK
jgi:hypothetical protein